MLKGASLLTKIIIGVCSAAAVTAATIVIVKTVNKKDAYRQIGVYEIEGKAEIERTDIGTMDAYVNMQLQSEDKADTKENSYMQLKLDEDKYILLDPLTKIELVAEGTSENSRTKIELLDGAIINRIEQPLSEESTYMVNTPNSTMSVRGTVFRVEVWKDKNNNYHTLLSVIEGTVISVLHDADGNLTGDIREFTAGEEAHMVEGTEASYYAGDAVEPELEDWMLEELEFIGVLFDYNQDAQAYMTEEELDELIEELLIDGADTPLGASARYKIEDETVPEPIEEQPVVPEDNTPEENQPEVTPEPENNEPETEPVEPQNNDVPEETTPVTEEVETDNTEVEEETDNGDTEVEENTDSETEDVENQTGEADDNTSETEDNDNNNSATEEDTTETENTEPEEDTTEENENSETDNTESEETEEEPEKEIIPIEQNNNTSGGGSSSGGGSTTPKTYTVTYIFGNGTTGTKVYNEGEYVTVPSIRPAKSGDWCVVGGTYDGINIETQQVPVTEDMEVSYIQ